MRMYELPGFCCIDPLLAPALAYKLVQRPCALCGLRVGWPGHSTTGTLQRAVQLTWQCVSFTPDIQFWCQAPQTCKLRSKLAARNTSQGRRLQLISHLLIRHYLLFESGLG
jgi:hypothetical protein